MKIFKKILIAIIIILSLPLLIALFIKKEYSVVREVQINKSNTQIFDYLKFLKNQDQFSKWARMDSTMKKTYTGKDGEVGFVSAWQSTNKEIGSGEQEIIMISPERIDYELRFKEPFESTEKAYMTITPISDSVATVKWGIDGKMDYPFNLMLLFMNFDKLIGEDFQFGLNNLKNILEKQ